MWLLNIINVIFFIIIIIAIIANGNCSVKEHQTFAKHVVAEVEWPLS